MVVDKVHKSKRRGKEEVRRQIFGESSHLEIWLKKKVSEKR
jgi:hypothetical protein